MAHSLLRLIWSSSWATTARAAGDAGSSNSTLDPPRPAPEPSLYEDVCRIGQAIAHADGLDLGDDDWASICVDWLTRTRPEIYDRGVTEDDVREAFAAWQVGRSP